MGNTRITEYFKQEVEQEPTADFIDLVSGFVSPVTVSRFDVNFAALGRGGRPSLPPLVQRDTWGLERRESFDPSFTPFLGVRY